MHSTGWLLIMVSLFNLTKEYIKPSKLNYKNINGRTKLRGRVLV